MKTLLSTSDPDELESPDTFDLVFVASLFTHLPDQTFAKWLAKLWTLVAPGGVLVFSVHDEAINRGGVPLEDGFAFMPMSEVASLSVDEYGTTLTTAGLRPSAGLQEAIGTEAGHAIRLPRALCFEQDVWVVSARGPDPRLRSSTSAVPSARSIASTSAAGPSRRAVGRLIAATPPSALRRTTSSTWRSA